MKHALLVFFVLAPILMGSACDQATPFIANESHDQVDQNNDPMKNKIIIKVGHNEFTGILADNASAEALKAMLPLTMNMTELNGNEKYFDLSTNFPAKASNPGTINTGDILLWGSKTLVIFYETFSTSYSYTRLGKVDNPTGLASALGNGNVTASIYLK
jgi:hypothetical protein